LYIANGFYLFFLISLLSACNISLDKVTLNGYTMGTTYSISYVSEKITVSQPKLDSILEDLNLSLSTYIDSSTISKANLAQDTFNMDPHFCSVISEALIISDETKGAFDCTVLPLVNAYGFGSENKKELNKRELYDIKNTVDYNTLKIVCTSNSCMLIKADKNTQIDLSAIAKGYAVDVLANYLDSLGVHDYLVEIGGEVRFKGLNEIGQYWRIGVLRPDTGVSNKNYIMVLSSEQMCLATSGNYRNYYWKDDVLFTHTINPQTGLPASNDLLSVTISASSCMSADAIATACMVMGKDEAIEFVESKDAVGAILFYTEGDSIIALNIGIDGAERL
jgi:thiamine biosynthesis lipoprotein